MQMADQQPCLEPARTMYPVMATLDPSFQSVLSSCSKPYTPLPSGWHMLQGCWGQDVASQLLPADRQCSVQPQWKNLSDHPCSAWLTEVLWYLTRQRNSSLASQVAKPKLKVQPPCPIPTQSKPKTNYCSQLSAFKKQIQSYLKQILKSIRTTREPTQGKTVL